MSAAPKLNVNINYDRLFQEEVLVPGEDVTASLPKLGAMEVDAQPISEAMDFLLERIDQFKGARLEIGLVMYAQALRSRFRKDITSEQYLPNEKGLSAGTDFPFYAYANVWMVLGPALNVYNVQRITRIYQLMHEFFDVPETFVPTPWAVKRQFRPSHLRFGYSKSTGVFYVPGTKAKREPPQLMKLRVPELFPIKQNKTLIPTNCINIFDYSETTTTLLTLLLMTEEFHTQHTYPDFVPMLSPLTKQYNAWLHNRGILPDNISLAELSLRGFVHTSNTSTLDGQHNPKHYPYLYCFYCNPPLLKGSESISPFEHEYRYLQQTASQY